MSRWFTDMSGRICSKCGADKIRPTTTSKNTSNPRPSWYYSQIGKPKTKFLCPPCYNKELRRRRKKRGGFSPINV